MMTYPVLYLFILYEKHMASVPMLGSLGSCVFVHMFLFQSWPEFVQCPHVKYQMFSVPRCASFELGA